MTGRILARAWVSDLRPMEAWEEQPYICPACKYATHHAFAETTKNGWWYCKYCYSNQRGANSRRVINFHLDTAHA